MLKKLMVCCGLILSAHTLLHAASDESLLIGNVTSQEKQQTMTPKQALLRLKEGNQRFLSNKQRQRDYQQQAKQASYGQFPFAVVLNCMDSRSVPELFFDQGLADLFTLRVAGNVLNDDMLGSMEFATKVVGARLIVVLSHTSCGAMAGACDGVNLGHLTDVVNKIKPMVAPSMQQVGIKNCTDPKLINQIAQNYAIAMVQQIQKDSPILRELVEKQQIGIIAGIHDIKTGQVRFFEESRSIPG